MRKKGFSKGAWLAILAVVLVVIDQVIKVLVKTNMSLGESIPVFGNWFQLLYTENEGFAFGMKFGGTVGKYILTAFRLVVAGALIWFILKLLGLDRRLSAGEKPVPTGVYVGVTMILAGAVGNIIDCLFYGLVWGEAPFMLGRVVDMFYFPLIDTVFPDWLPVIGGKPFRFFAAIFNFADSCVTCGALYLLLFKYSFFAKDKRLEGILR